MSELELLKAQVAELLEWKAQKTRQQITKPLDLASRNELGVFLSEGAGSTTKTQSVGIGATPTNITVPAAYVQTLVLVVGGVRYEVPSLI